MISKHNKLTITTAITTTTTDIKHLLDKAMADIEIYSGEQSNIRRGQRPSWILS